MENLFIYLLQVMDIIDVVVCIAWCLFIGFIIALIINLIVTGGSCESFIPDEDDKKYNSECYKLYLVRKYIVKGGIISTLIAVSLSLIPTKQTLLLMGGRYLGRKAVNAVVTDEKIKKIDTIINLQLDKYIKDLKQEVK